MSTVTAGKAVKGLTQGDFLKPSKKFMDAMVGGVDASKCATEVELFYARQYFREFGETEDYGWSTLTLQEKKVVNSLQEENVLAYIGYRVGFKQGLKRKDIKQRPVFGLVELQASCNLKCEFCFQSDRYFSDRTNVGSMDIDVAKSIIDQLDEMKVRGLTFASRGEPLLYKDLDKVLSHLGGKQNIFEVKINTNASNLQSDVLEMILESKVNLLVVSTDHYEKGMYESLRKGANYERFIENIRIIEDSRRRYKREETLYTRASGVHIDKGMNTKKFKEFYNRYFDETEVTERWNTYGNVVHEDYTAACGMPSERLYIWHDGTTNPCDSDYKSFLSPGNAIEIGVKKSWDNLSKLRDDMQTGHRLSNIPCDRCGIA